MKPARHIDPAAVLTQCPLFGGASAEDLRALASIAAQSHWTTGTLIFQQGDPGDFLIIVGKGRIRLSLTTSAGRELTIRHAGPGAAVGEMSVLDQDKRSADATAETEVEGLVIRRAALERALAERPGLSQAVIRYLSRRLRETTYQLESVALYELSARLARFLLAALRHSHGPHLPATASLTLDLGQGEIAAILGASRPKVNRALADLAASGAIHRRDNVVECSVAKLTAIAAADGP